MLPLQRARVQTLVRETRSAGHTVQPIEGKYLKPNNKETKSPIKQGLKPYVDTSSEDTQVASKYVRKCLILCREVIAN